MASRLELARIREKAPGIEVLTNKEFWKDYLLATGIPVAAMYVAEKTTSPPIPEALGAFMTGWLAWEAIRHPWHSKVTRLALLASAVTVGGLTAYRIKKELPVIKQALKKLGKAIKEGKVKEVLMFFTPKGKEMLKTEEAPIYVPEEYIPIQIVEEKVEEVKKEEEEKQTAPEQEQKEETKKEEEERPSGLLI